MPHHNQALGSWSRFLPDEAATLTCGAWLARGVVAGLKIYLHGDLGSGKTTLIRGVLRGLGHVGKVKSPTFTLLELYEVSSLYLYHFDFYRFTDSGEWEDAGFRDYFDAKSVCMVEWPEKVGDLLPSPDVEIRLCVEGNGRRITVSARTEAGSQCLDRVSSEDPE
jgi:tRNA threonylcarbamoyladenosine biosynthesis protein TsaE